jgi:hypothetical protein
MLARAVSALVVPWAAGWPCPARGIEHWTPGGSGGIQRGQFGFTPSSAVGGLGTIKLPLAASLYMVPLTTQLFDESAGARYQLQGDGLVTVLADGLYDLTANVDWAAPSGVAGVGRYDVNGRKLLVKRVPTDIAPPVYVPGQVTRIATNAVLYDTLAGRDMAGSSVPNTVRVETPWSPGAIAPGAMASIDVALPAGSFTPSLGDLARVAHTGLADALLGAANTGLLISARMVAAGVARVMIENRYNPVAVTIPAGTLKIVAESAVSTAGGSANGWAWVGSGPVQLQAGEKLMIALRSESQGDFLQVGDASFLRIRNIVP